MDGTFLTTAHLVSSVVSSDSYSTVGLARRRFWVILQTQTPPFPKSDTPPDPLPQRSQSLSSSSSSSQAPSQATPFTAAGTVVEASALPQAGDQNLSE